MAGLFLLTTGCFSAIDYGANITCELHDNCPAGFYCAQDVCVPGDRDDVPCGSDNECLGNEHCGANHNCEGGVRQSCTPAQCAALGTDVICTSRAGQPVCAVPECLNDFNCGSSMVCEATACTWGRRSGSGRADGVHCTDSWDCAGSDCYFLTDDRSNTFCVDTCNPINPYGSCDEGTFCHIDRVCLPLGTGGFGVSCAAPMDCAGGLCVAGIGCTFFCDADSDCISGWTCETVSSSNGDVRGCVRH